MELRRAFAGSRSSPAGRRDYFLASRLFAPILSFLEGRTSFEDTQRRITQLPLLTAQNVLILMAILTVFRLGSSYFLNDPAASHMPVPSLSDVLTLCIILPVFHFTYTYFVISDYLGRLCGFIFRHYGRTLGLFFGSYTVKLIVALVVISIAPMAAIVVDLFSYDGDRLRFEIGNDVAVSLMGVALTAYFITRSMLRPIRILTGAMEKVAAGDLSQRVPVTSNDEVGALTGQFNNMVEGLRERERIRETFGRYVDESVASTILRREGEGVLAGEMREATVLFTDIAGFTTIAEHLAPDELVVALTNISRRCWRRSAPMAASSIPSSATGCSPRSTCRWPAKATPSPPYARPSTSNAPSTAAPSAMSAWPSQPASASAPAASSAARSAPASA